jgi:hypothetical protein
MQLKEGLCNRENNAVYIIFELYEKYFFQESRL